MGQRETTRLLIQRAFPGHDEVIERGLREHPTFHELCDDYRRCARALEDRKRRHGSGNADRVCEYEQLLSELADEVQGWLEALSEIRSSADMPAQ
ncbi:MAG: hypothetical protein P8172_16260 [Gammaproteobacteria bacterium]|jgi:hypothetical protein